MIEKIATGYSDDAITLKLANGVGSELEQRWSLSDDKPLQQNYARVATNTHLVLSYSPYVIRTRRHLWILGSYYCTFFGAYKGPGEILNEPQINR